MAMLKIDGVGMPAPVSFDIPTMDLDSDGSYRDESGQLHRDRVRQGVYKIPAAWEKLTTVELNTLISAMTPAKFAAEFPDHTGYVTKQMYAGDRNTKVEVFNTDHSKIIWALSVNLIEY